MDTKGRVLREEIPFSWDASCGMPAYATLAGVRFDRIFLEGDAIVESCKRGRPIAQELFGPDVRMGGPTWAEISYGHINALGSRLIFPEDSEVAHTPIYGSLREGIEALNRETDFTRQAMFPFYLDLWQKLKKAFPGERIVFEGFKAEGPVTTAWLLRGHDFFTDILDEPELAKEYLHAVTSSVIRYEKTVRRINGKPEFGAEGAYLADDVAAMVAPTRWPELVRPFLERYYREQTTGARRAHIEDLRVDHLKYLDELRLSSYDPSVSHRLNPALIRDNCSVPFTWRLNSTHYPDRSEQKIEAWVFDAAAGGASGVRTIVAREMCNLDSAGKIRAFVRAAKRVKTLLDAGCPRRELMRRM